MGNIGCLYWIYVTIWDSSIQYIDKLLIGRITGFKEPLKLNWTYLGHTQKIKKCSCRVGVRWFYLSRADGPICTSCSVAALLYCLFTIRPSHSFNGDKKATYNMNTDSWYFSGIPLVIVHTRRDIWHVTHASAPLIDRHSRKDISSSSGPIEYPRWLTFWVIRVSDYDPGGNYDTWILLIICTINHRQSLWGWLPWVRVLDNQCFVLRTRLIEVDSSMCPILRNCKSH